VPRPGSLEPPTEGGLGRPTLVAPRLVVGLSNSAAQWEATGGRSPRRSNLPWGGRGGPGRAGSQKKRYPGRVAPKGTNQVENTRVGGASENPGRAPAGPPRPLGATGHGPSVRPKEGKIWAAHRGETPLAPAPFLGGRVPSGGGAGLGGPAGCGRSRPDGLFPARPHFPPRGPMRARRVPRG